MNTAQAPPVTPPTQPVTTEGTPTSLTTNILGSLFAALGAFAGVFALAFAVGAGYLSYRTYGSTPWAIMAFFFPYIYYPYYAYFATIPPPQQAMFGGKRAFQSIFKMMKL